jgi:hypothetical protein
LLNEVISEFFVCIHNQHNNDTVVDLSRMLSLIKHVVLLLYFNTIPMKLFFSCWLIFSVGQVFGQATSNNDSDSLAKRGVVLYTYDSGIEELIEKYKKSNYSNSGVEGYRVQIFTGAGNDSKSKAESALQEFLSSFPDEVGYLTYQQPNFKVRCGDYRSKSEARKLMKKISYQYPGSYIVKDNIKVD